MYKPMLNQMSTNKMVLCNFIFFNVLSYTELRKLYIHSCSHIKTATHYVSLRFLVFKNKTYCSLTLKMKLYCPQCFKFREVCDKPISFQTYRKMKISSWIYKLILKLNTSKSNPLHFPHLC
jgi:hypothetical protein